MQREALLTKAAVFKTQKELATNSSVHHKSLIWLRLKAALELMHFSMSLLPFMQFF
jgi:hypothetical protein